MKINQMAVRQCLKSFDFKTLFREHLGWDNHQGQLDIPLDGSTFSLSAVAQKRGFAAYVCPAIPDRPTRLKIDHQVTKSSREHLIVYADKGSGQQVWQWVRREPGKPLAPRDHRFDVAQSGDPLIQRLDAIAVSLDEEEMLTVVDVAGRARAAFDVEKVTKQFYDRFKSEHTAFQKFIKGIKEQADLEWYTSLMLNRMMFVYFIQKKGFLDGDRDYLRLRMKLMRQEQGKDKFVTFYRYFLVRLFHDGLGKAKPERDAALDKLLGNVPYLNGGFFEVHQLEEKYTDIDIPDKAFEKLFDFFDQYRWHLDERPLRQDNEINPDVVGYIFEKYINQKQMGAYYTKEDITEYMSKNTIIPFLFDAAEKTCPIAFKPDSYLWRLLKEDPDRYIHSTIRHGVIDAQGIVIPLPAGIEAGVTDVAKRDGWNKPALDPYALPTETWREHLARRSRCLSLRQKVKGGEVCGINDLITLNLDLWQLARDAITSSEGPELLRAFWQAIQKLTCLDPTCGSGAFLFAALRILESLYSDCLERMEQFVEELAGKDHHPEKFSDFKAVLEQTAKHPNQRYFILKSVIINNLFGVDIMEEAVEICKLRLFLKLVAQVETVEQIEPLPDIDFNIRAGNTLVGFATLDHVRKSMEGTLGFAEKQVERIKEDAIAVECVFKLFREQQTKHGGKITAKDKQELRRRLEKLDLELDRYLAAEYRIDAVKKPAEFEEWRKSHQPFHWFVEFYGIMRDGGFDVVVGNPPYVEYKDVKPHYTVLGFETLACNDLYAYTVERACAFTSAEKRIGLIVPISIFGTDGFASLQTLARRAMGPLWVSTYSNRPAQLFDGAQKRLTIMIGKRSAAAKGPTALFTTSYLRWKRDEREALFPVRVNYGLNPLPFKVFPASLEKLGAALEVTAFKKLAERGQRLSGGVSDDGKWPVYYTRKFGYFLAFLNFVPEIREIKTGAKKLPSELKEINFDDQRGALCAIAALSSSSFFWFWNVLSDCRNLNRRDLLAFPLDPTAIAKGHRDRLAELGDQYVTELRAGSRWMTKSGLRIQTFDYARCKPLINLIDRELAKVFGLTDEETDFVLNYDTKYRVGADDGDGED